MRREEREEQKASATLGKKEEKRFIYTHILPTYHFIPISVRTPSILLSTSKMELLKVKTGRQMVEITANMLLLLYGPVMRSFLFLFLIPSQVRQSHSHPSSLYAVVELFLFYYYYYFGVFFLSFCLSSLFFFSCRRYSLNPACCSSAESYKKNFGRQERPTKSYSSGETK